MFLLIFVRTFRYVTKLNVTGQNKADNGELFLKIQKTPTLFTTTNLTIDKVVGKFSYYFDWVPRPKMFTVNFQAFL